MSTTISSAWRRPLRRPDGRFAGHRGARLGRLPGLAFSTGKTDYRPLKQMRLQRFNGTSWDLLDEVISE